MLTDPGYLAFVTDPGSEFDAVYGGWNPALVLPDILQLFGIDTGASGVSDLVDPATAVGGLDGAMSVDLSTLLGGFDAGALTADLSILLENLGTALAPDLATAVLNVF
jgi:hypothetical protein